MPGSGMFLQTNMAVPAVGVNQAANLGGSAMQPHTAVPLLPSMAFSARGTGTQSLTLDASGPRLSGVQGSLDLLISMGAAGTARTVCVLTDDPASPTRYLAIKIDTTNRPYLVMTNAAGTVIAQVGPSFAALVSGQTAAIRMAWDSRNIVDVPTDRRATFKVNRTPVASSDWSTNPNANWTSFQPTHIRLGVSLGDADFNGVISAVQVSNVVSP